MVFSKNVEVECRQNIINILGVKEVDKHKKYLGLPTIIWRSKKATFACVKEKIWKKLQGWKEKLLSKPGKETIIKFVAQDIPTYNHHVFCLPCGVLYKVHSLLARFWWGAKDAERKMH